MKRTLSLLILLVLVLLLGCTAQRPPEPTVLDDVTIDMAVEPDPPAVGEATLLFTITDADDTPIQGATLQVHGDMDHEGMISVEGETGETVDGIYHVPFNWTMGGGWILDVTATLPDERVTTVQFTLFVEAISPDSIIHEQSAEADGDSINMDDNSDHADHADMDTMSAEDSDNQADE